MFDMDEARENSRYRIVTHEKVRPDASRWTLLGDSSVSAKGFVAGSFELMRTAVGSKSGHIETSCVREDAESACCPSSWDSRLGSFTHWRLVISRQGLPFRNSLDVWKMSPIFLDLDTVAS